ncbi:MAG: glutamate racemase [Candidatus Portnoybacteria bacterium CG10_big_fil_rev_8_21_14_0_10_44_7]|uniref:Glutamate racemase n=1 Tax=Candidatus Portnoybacteria bacterium CG10_big_fil_rev_8_21_14_0_10_44_7 TaxID=1974816 RepID=A0A2M8KI72_9BACT|nr:MAG: glutamate racemase [Candidatus Portnoybacteria bacterium CG10_big_fil_rev_8_21_14_0_10_44_7]
MIGLFDSGFGGLTILKGILRKLPQYDFVYLGDNARVPYGTRSQEVILDFSRQAVDFLFNHGCDLVLFACNTASAQALRQIQQKYLPLKYANKNVLGVIRPTAEVAVTTTRNGRIGVLATESTVTSNSFVVELKQQNKNIKVFQNAAPLLVPIVEAGETNWRGTDLLLRRYLKPLMEKKIDTLVLGCTHYPLLKKKIRKIVGPQVKVISQDEIVGSKLKKYLERHPEYEKKLGRYKKRVFYTTDYSPRFARLAQRFFSQKIRVKKIVRL